MSGYKDHIVDIIAGLEISGVVVDGTYEGSENDCSKDVFWGDDFDAVLAIFRSYGVTVKAFEAAAKIAADEGDYHKCLFCFVVCMAAVYW